MQNYNTGTAFANSNCKSGQCRKNLSYKYQIIKELNIENLEEINGGKIKWSWKAPLTMGDVACVAGLLGSVMLGGVTFGIGAAIGGTLVLGACEYLVHSN